MSASYALSQPTNLWLRFSRPEWGVKTYEGLEASALIPSVDIHLPLAELYALALTVPE